MKLNKIKNMCRTLSAIALLGSTLCTSCISEDINRNPLLPTKEDEKMDGVIFYHSFCYLAFRHRFRKHRTGKPLSDRSKSGR